MMKKKVAFVLGGGGSRGAFQVGALRALLEAGIYPDLLVGSSIGAVNAAFFAIHCLPQRDISPLEEVWKEAAKENLLPASHLWLTVRTLFNKHPASPVHRLKDFFIDHGIDENLRFKDLPGVELFCVASDLNHSSLQVYGRDPNERVLDGVLASSALPPWATLVEANGSLLLDGGALSNLPVEQALKLGATQIIALDLTDTRNPFGDAPHFGPFLAKLINAVHSRQAELEIALAESRGATVHRLRLQGKEPVQIWDFRDAPALIELGYETARREILAWPKPASPGWRGLLKTWTSKG
jgi:NTE family protein